jgi:hypothetical protein
VAITAGVSNRAKLRSLRLDPKHRSVNLTGALCETQLYPPQNSSGKVDIHSFQSTTGLRNPCEKNASPHTLAAQPLHPPRNSKGILNRRLPLQLRYLSQKQQASKKVISPMLDLHRSESKFSCPPPILICEKVVRFLTTEHLLILFTLFVATQLPQPNHLLRHCFRMTDPVSYLYTCCKWVLRSHRVRVQYTLVTSVGRVAKLGQYE